MNELCKYVDDFLDQSLSGEDAQKFDAHLQTCSDCRQQVEDQSKLSLLLHEAWHEVHASDELQEKIRITSEAKRASKNIDQLTASQMGSNRMVTSPMISVRSHHLGRRTLMVALASMAALVLVTVNFGGNSMVVEPKPGTAKQMDLKRESPVESELISAEHIQPVVQVEPLNRATETLALPAKRTSPNFTIVNLYSTQFAEVDSQSEVGPE